MNRILIYGKKQNATGIDISDIDAAYRVVEALKKDGWKVVWMVHTTDQCYPRQGYEKDYEEWKKLTIV